jgi:hypothetical protein
VASTATSPSGHDRLAEGVDIEALDAEVESAIRAGDAGAMRVLGYGEFTLVLGWPTARPEVAVKRLPAFRDADQLARYEETLQRYIGGLEGRGVAVMPTELRATPARGELHAYLIQPLARRDALLNSVLGTTQPARGRELLNMVAGHVAATVDGSLGLDAQAGNWMVSGDGLVILDVSTPLMRSPQGRDELDLALFESIYPPAVRGLLRRIAPMVMSQYHDPRTVLVDFGSNLIKERLEQWLPVLCDAANEHVSPPVTERVLRRYFARDKRFWLSMQRLRRIDRAWQRQVRRRPYPFLLPPPYAYGPPELPEEQS